MIKVINNYIGTANTLISYIVVPLFVSATAIIDQYGLLSTHVWLPHSLTDSHNIHTKLNSLNHQSFLRENQALLSSTGGIWLCYTVLYAPCLFSLTYTSQQHTVCFKHTWCLTVFLASRNNGMTHSLTLTVTYTGRWTPGYEVLMKWFSQKYMLYSIIHHIQQAGCLRLINE
jgi:hypothetical protein